MSNRAVTSTAERSVGIIGSVGGNQTLKKWSIAACAVGLLLIAGSVHADGMSDEAIGAAGLHSSENQRDTRATMASANTSSARGTRFEKASAADQSIATGHFARTRSMLIAALNEFDQGVKRADPSTLMDVKAFREGLRARARELERILEPQARDSESGVKFSGDNRLLKQR